MWTIASCSRKRFSIYVSRPLHANIIKTKYHSGRIYTEYHRHSATAQRHQPADACHRQLHRRYLLGTRRRYTDIRQPLLQGAAWHRQYPRHHETENIRLAFVWKRQKSWKEFAECVKRGETSQGYIVHNPLPLRPEVLAIEGNAYWVTSDKGEGTVWTFGRDVSTRIRHEQQIKQFYLILDKIIETSRQALL